MSDTSNGDPESTSEPSWRERMGELNPDALFIGNSGETRFDKAIVGIGERCGQPALIVYDYEKIVAVLMEDDDMDEEGAREFADFNIVGAWLGEHTPIILYT